jgi:hypothetical protein
VGITRHALDRMNERDVTVDAVRHALLAEPKKLAATRKLTGPGHTVHVGLGDLSLVLADTVEVLTVVSVWRRGRAT